jgi:prepilin-type N-terminal cleavage/methylation domain-containing protein
MRLGMRNRNGWGQRGLTLIEVLVAMGLMGIMAYACAAIYFSQMRTYNEYALKLPPYDEATRSVDRVTNELRGAMVIESATATSMIVLMPLRDANGENVLVDGDTGFNLVAGDRVAFYLSDASGSMDATGNCLWKAIQHPDELVFTPRIMIGENIHPELNPVDASTGQPHVMFKYWPDEVRLYGVELWMTSTATSGHQTETQTAHSETYLRNL